VEPGTTSTFVTDYKREAALARAPYFQLLFRGSNAAEVQGHSRSSETAPAPTALALGPPTCWQVFLRLGARGRSAGGKESTPGRTHRSSDAGKNMQWGAGRLVILFMFCTMVHIVKNDLEIEILSDGFVCTTSSGAGPKGSFEQSRRQ
jgi:hypothetical protein